MSEVLTFPKFEALEQALADLEALLEASEAHGFICGAMCAGVSMEDTLLYKMILGDYRQGDARAKRVCHDLQIIYQVSERELQDMNFTFSLLIPSEEYVIQSRAECLAAWCNGFVVGLQMSKEDALIEEHEEVREALLQIQEVAHLDFVHIDEDNEAEHDFMELEEYVRMAVILIYQELIGAEQDKRTLH